MESSTIFYTVEFFIDFTGMDTMIYLSVKLRLLMKNVDLAIDRGLKSVSEIVANEPAERRREAGEAATL